MIEEGQSETDAADEAAIISAQLAFAQARAGKRAAATERLKQVVRSRYAGFFDGRVVVGIDAIVVVGTDGIFVVGIDATIAVGADAIVLVDTDGIVVAGTDALIVAGVDPVVVGTGAIIVVGTDAIIIVGADAIVVSTDVIVVVGTDATIVIGTEESVVGVCRRHCSLPPNRILTIVRGTMAKCFCCCCGLCAWNMRRGRSI